MQDHANGNPNDPRTVDLTMKFAPIIGTKYVIPVASYKLADLACRDICAVTYDMRGGIGWPLKGGANGTEAWVWDVAASGVLWPLGPFGLIGTNDWDTAQHLATWARDFDADPSPIVYLMCRAQWPGIGLRVQNYRRVAGYLKQAAPGWYFDSSEGEIFAPAHDIVRAITALTDADVEWEQVNAETIRVPCRPGLTDHELGTIAGALKRAYRGK
jgi:hypothetical protein